MSNANPETHPEAKHSTRGKVEAALLTACILTIYFEGPLRQSELSEFLVNRITKPPEAPYRTLDETIVCAQNLGLLAFADPKTRKIDLTPATVLSTERLIVGKIEKMDGTVHPYDVPTWNDFARLLGVTSLVDDEGDTEYEDLPTPQEVTGTV
jgi:hypothetical protein